MGHAGTFLIPASPYQRHLCLVCNPYAIVLHLNRIDFEHHHHGSLLFASCDSARPSTALAYSIEL